MNSKVLNMPCRDLDHSAYIGGQMSTDQMSYPSNTFNMCSASISLGRRRTNDFHWQYQDSEEPKPPCGWRLKCRAACRTSWILTTFCINLNLIQIKEKKAHANHMVKERGGPTATTKQFHLCHWSLITHPICYLGNNCNLNLSIIYIMLLLLGASLEHQLL